MKNAFYKGGFNVPNRQFELGTPWERDNNLSLINLNLFIQAGGAQSIICTNPQNNRSKNASIVGVKTLKSVYSRIILCNDVRRGGTWI